jgi:hypothetical protein
MGTDREAAPAARYAAHHADTNPNASIASSKKTPGVFFLQDPHF